MRIVADENIPWAREAFSAFGDVRSLPGRAIAREHLLEADALVVRSVTAVNADLLSGTPVRFVGTATIGDDHVDIKYLEREAIAFATAAGSNATSVAEYVVAALLDLRERGLSALEGRSLGVIGVGDVGSRVAAFADALGMRVVKYDPPRALREPAFGSASFEELEACDVITLHVPLEHHGEHATRHLINAAFLDRLGSGTILINTSRGSVVESDALLRALHAGRLAGAVLDVWENEPAVPRDLIACCAIATPHIAGYAADAKLRGTLMMADALAAFTGTTQTWDSAGVLAPRAGVIELPPAAEPLDAAAVAVGSACPVRRDDAELRSLLDLDDAGRRSGFDRIRRDYPERREFAAYETAGADPAAASMLRALGFHPTPPTRL